MAINYQFIFQIIVSFTIFQRIYELFLAKKNEKVIIAQGGRIIKEKNYIYMVLLHTSWLASLSYFAFFTDLRSFSQNLFCFSILLFLFGQFLRVTAIKTLGKRWSTRIVILPDTPAINTGIFKFIRHPNYLGVILELAFLPLVASLFYISIIFSILNLVILYFRIKKEEKELKKFNNYAEIFHLEGIRGK